jgi:hypothetical protein
MTDTYNSYNMEEITAKVRTLYLDGLKFGEIQKALDIKASTWDSWVYKDYKDFRHNLQKFKFERLVRKAEGNVEVLMDSEDERVATTNNWNMLKTQGKDMGYSERTEVTGKDGGKLEIVFDKAFNTEEE